MLKRTYSSGTTFFCLLQPTFPQSVKQKAKVDIVSFCSIDKVCWADVTLPADSKGCQHFSTKKLLKVLIEAMKHAINDVIPSDEENNSKDKCVTCKQKKDMVVLEVKVYL